jgi:fluoroacetyl-CoA thioesterase
MSPARRSAFPAGWAWSNGDPLMSLEPGMARSDDFVVEDRLVTDVGGTIGVSVLSTPGMVGMMERTASILAFENLPDGKATVGFEVCIKHVAAAAEGATCTITAKLREIADERKLRFDVEVTEGDRTIGVGTHERRVIEVGGVKQA